MDFNGFGLAGDVAMVLPFGLVAFHHWTSLLSHSNIACLVGCIHLVQMAVYLVTTVAPGFAGDGADAKILQDKECFIRRPLDYRTRHWASEP
jgi:hypothetical protein